MTKTLQQIQQEVDAHIGQFKEGYFSPLVMLARLTEEVGELAREVNDRFGQKPKRWDEPHNTIDMELADIFFVVVCFANALDIQLEDAYDRAMEKFRTRDADRWTRKEQKTEEESS